MNLQVEISNSVDENEWNRTLTMSKDSSIYQTTFWAQIYKNSYDSVPVFVSIRDSKSNLVGQLTSLIHKKMLWAHSHPISRFIGQGLNLNSILTWQYGPIIHDEENKKNILDRILFSLKQVAKENNIAMIRGSTSPYLEGNQKMLNSSFKNQNYSSQPWSTYLVNLKQNEEEFFQQLDKKTRYDIRKSEEKDLVFEETNNVDTIHELLMLKAESNKKARLQGLDRNKRFVIEHKQLIDLGLEHVFIIKHENEIVGGIIVPHFNGNIIQHGVTISSQRKLMVGTFLTWKVLKFFLNKEFFYFDMGGFNPNPETKKEENIDFFKSKWNGIQTDFVFHDKILDKKKIAISSFLRKFKGYN